MDYEKVGDVLINKLEDVGSMVTLLNSIETFPGSLHACPVLHGLVHS